MSSSSSEVLNVTANVVAATASPRSPPSPTPPTLECSVCVGQFTKHIRKPIVCPVSTCGYSACQTCYKTFLTTDGITASKCMKCNTEFTPAFLKSHFTETFVKKDLRKHFTSVLVQRQVVQMPASQPKAERELLAREKVKEVDEIDKLMKSLTIQRRILIDDIRFLRNAQNHTGNGDGEAVSGFQHKCCDSECPGFVSSAWKCGICNKFSCTHCHEVKGSTTQEVEAHECNPENVESIKFMKLDTKPCPACGVYIHKTQGCDQMFCTSCKQLWSWNTGRIETRGHNPHYLEWMRTHGELERDPQDVQCGREIDRGFMYQTNLKYAKLLTRCPIEIRGQFETVFQKDFPEIARSLLHLRLNDIPTFQRNADIEARVSLLRVGYLCKDFDMQSLRRRVFKLHQTGEVSRNILDLLAAVQNASTDILYRALSEMTETAEFVSRLSFDDCTGDKLIKYRSILETMGELNELHKYAETCLSEIYWTHSISTGHRFRPSTWFALTF